MKVCYLAKVNGVVQGVYFRAEAQIQAIDLSLSGYAHNQEDGTLEVLVCGEESNVLQMLDWLEEGPSDADVDYIEAEQVPIKDLNHFSIG